jgi:hypothetical protein
MVTPFFATAEKGAGGMSTCDLKAESGPNVKKQPSRAVIVRSQPAGLQGDEYM